MRKTGSILARVGDLKTNQVWKYVFRLYDEKMYPVYKHTEIVFYYFFKF